MLSLLTQRLGRGSPLLYSAFLDRLPRGRTFPILDLIGVPGTIEDGTLCMIPEWMSNDDITEHVLVHGCHSGVGISPRCRYFTRRLEGCKSPRQDFSNTAYGKQYLADKYRPRLSMPRGFRVRNSCPRSESRDRTVGLHSRQGNCFILAQELLVPPKFGLGKCIPAKGSDVYAIAMVIYLSTA